MNGGECSYGRIYLVPKAHLWVLEVGFFPAVNSHKLRAKPGDGLRCYNPWSKRHERRTAQVTRELARYKVDIAALSETRFSEQGQLEEEHSFVKVSQLVFDFMSKDKEKNLTTDYVYRRLSFEFGRKSIAESSACLKELYSKVYLRRHVLAHRAVIYWLKFDRRSELIITASDDYTIKIWSLQPTNNLDAPFLRHTLRGHAAEIVGVDLSIDNHLLASADADCSLVIWCLRTGQQLISFRGCRNNRAISGLQFIPLLPVNKRHSSLNDCTGWLLVATYSGGLHFIPYKHQTVGGVSTSTNDSVDCCVLRLNPTITIDNLEASVLSLDISQGWGEQTEVQQLRYYAGLSLFKRRNLLALEAAILPLDRDRIKITKAWTNDDRYLVVSTKSGSVYVFVGETGEVTNVLRGHEGAVYAVAVSPFDEEIIATGGVDGRFYIWNLAAHRVASRRRPGEAEGSSPVLAFYRYPQPQMETDLGIAWPLPQYDNQEPLPQALGTHAPGGDESGEQAAPRGAAASASLLISRNSLMHNYANNSRTGGGGGGGGGISQQITACVAAPAAEGPAFLVSTKAGVISLFSFSGSPEGETTAEEANVPYEEQFLHWEMDAAELHEVTAAPDDPQSAAVAIALGSPPCQQSFSSPGRAPYGSRLSAITGSAEALMSPRVDTQQQQQRPLSLNNVYRPPPGVLFQLVHAPSQVPFSRLPPAYLTTLKGCVYPLERQRRQICGRRHLSRPLDLQPTLAFDEDGEEVVVDDIQFCGCVPATYCYPPPRQTVVQGAAGKNYLWRCHWLCDGNSIITPLSPSELDLAYRRLTALNQLEREHFQAPAAVPVAAGATPMECDVSPSEGPSTSMRHNTSIDIGCLPSSSALPESPAQEEAVPTVVSPSDMPSSLFININRTTTGGPDVPHSDVEYAPSDSEESEWSAHIDAEIGWWQRRRRRRSRRAGGEARIVTANGSRRMAFGTSTPSEEVILVSEVVPTQTNISQNTATGTVSSLSGALRRSARQRRRSLAQSRTERDQSRMASRSSQLQAARQQRRARRSERLRRFLQDTAVVAAAAATTTTTTASSPATGDDSTSRDAFIDRRGRNHDQSPLITVSPSKSREVMKQQLIQSIDYTSMNRVKLPLEHPPPLGYSGPLPCFASTISQSLHHDKSLEPWPGPNLDWLSVTAPTASPYVPQLGDHVVYIVRGHKEYLEKAWQGGRIPPLDRSHQPLSSLDNSPLNSVYLELPWEENPGLPGYICCRVEELAFHFMRINSGGQPPHRGGGDRSWRHPPSTGVRRRRPLASSSSRLRRSPFCTLGDTNQDPGPCGESTTINLPFGTSEQPTDSFVRLATLRLRVETSQPYVGIGSHGTETTATASLPHELLIRYHDVDGVLDFIVLRNLFNESLSRGWNTGEVFVCPVDDVWWRGRVLSPFPALLSSSHQSASVSVTWGQASPPTALPIDPSSTDSLPLLLSPRDPWLGVRVRWLENEECGNAQEPLLPPSLWAAAAAATADRTSIPASSRGLGGASFDLESLSQGRGRFRGDPHADTRVLLPDRSPGKPMLLPTDAQSEPDVVLTFSDYLSPWDMHLWTSRLPVSDSPIASTSNAVAPTSASVSFLRSSEVRLPSVRLTELFGSGCYVADHPPFLLAVVRRMEHFLDKIMSLGASEVFIKPVDLAAYPNYLLVNPYLVDFLFIRQRLHNLFYREVDAIRFDIEQIHANAMRYNEPNSLIVRQAQLITMLAVRALDDPSYTEEAMLEEYTAAIRQQPALDPSLPLPPSASVTALPSTTSVANAGEPSIASSPTTKTLPVRSRSRQQASTSSRVSTSPPSTTRLLKRARQVASSDTNHNSALGLSTRRPSEAPIKRFHLEDEEVCQEDHATTGSATTAADTAAAGPTHRVDYTNAEDVHSRLRRLPAALSPYQESSPEFLDWRQACCTLLTELRRSHRSVFFRQPVDITQYPPDGKPPICCEIDLCTPSFNYHRRVNAATTQRLCFSCGYAATCTHPSLLVWNSFLHFAVIPYLLSALQTYALFVQAPMDLSTVKQRLESTAAVGSGGGDTSSPRRRLPSAERQSSAHCCYTSARDFLADLNLIVANSRSFNRRPGTQVYADTRWLSKWIRRVAERRLRPFLSAAPPEISGGKRSARSRSTSRAASSRTATHLRVQPLRLRRSPETARLHFCAQQVIRGRQRQGQLTSTRLASFSSLSRSRPSVSSRRPGANKSRYHLRTPPVVDVSGSTPVPEEHSNTSENYDSDFEVTSAQVKQRQPAPIERRTSRGRISRPPVRPDDNFETLLPSRRRRRRRTRRTTDQHVRPQSPAQSQTPQRRDRPRRASGVRRYYYTDEEDENGDYHNSDAFVVV
ncbi:unnamed protein product [Schistocephalus solidus]|uniref:WD_REPEATS_REGION domain-containing protein n=1 Tax=Schistocephalus solidus TaxID=70667 RepID=A0A183SGU8_SCHSO|nr:unnamed protein product [Schistocephalus solidus]